jgi:hypothetical protein
MAHPASVRLSAMTPTTDGSVLRGRSRRGVGAAVATTVRLEASAFSVTAGDSPPWWAAYRDVARVSVDGGQVAVDVGSADADPWIFDQFGAHLGALARGLREGRFRQWLADGLVEEGASEPIELLEVETAGGRWVAQVLYHSRGVAVAPLDEGQAPRRIRRAEIDTVSGEQGSGRVRIGAGDLVLELVGLGPLETAHRQRWLMLRDAAAADMAAIVGGHLADAPFELRRLALERLREGHPRRPEDLEATFPLLESAVQTEPGFAESYRALLERAGGRAAPRWIALAPARPGAPGEAVAWFLVGLPGNLLALELVSEGAHATYLYRVAPRATFVEGALDPTSLADAVDDVSEALIDARFLREPMAIPAERLAEPANLRYRLALAVLPTLAAARARVVARLVHTDIPTWSDALDDVIAWHRGSRDDGDVWPGRSAHEAAIEGAAATPPMDAAPS